MHIVKSDTWTLGVSWLDKEIYGEGGLEIHLGKRIICFWEKYEPCLSCLEYRLDCWPRSEEVWRCPKCDTEYRDE